MSTKQIKYPVNKYVMNLFKGVVLKCKNAYVTRNKS